MALIVFERFKENKETFIRDTGEKYSLAGWSNGLLYKAWEKKGKPLDKGWQVSADELIHIYSGKEHSASTRLLGIDWHPDSKKRIGVIELLNVYAFTWKDDNGGAEWTPLMLQLRELLYIYKTEHIEDGEKEKNLTKIPNPSLPQGDIVEFLYLHGDDGSWRWGRSGMTNAAFIHDEARDYFRKFF